MTLRDESAAGRALEESSPLNLPELNGCRMPTAPKGDRQAGDVGIYPMVES
ncbi:hypothetical protein ACFOY2_14715 [Nonomuraea purpurea]|uniref:Uncharacterized protein n=1 Tax=Nonomuraea purpurea TaxID=1849276 RepID=A0ABV8G396_9ACTN